ncbi:unnamed protein product [Linum trigynum]|uniref:Uncharacterized protein n=1 Tax=Linum trigynum TaxID=586398 RepID=A0AAV2GSA5_9ROSI
MGLLGRAGKVRRRQGNGNWPDCDGIDGKGPNRDWVAGSWARGTGVELSPATERMKILFLQVAIGRQPAFVVENRLCGVPRRTRTADGRER